MLLLRLQLLLLQRLLQLVLLIRISEVTIVTITMPAQEFTDISETGRVYMFINTVPLFQPLYS